MSTLLTALAVSFATVFVAELGDKSQLLTLAFATKYRPAVVLTGITIVSVVMHGLAVLVGGTLGAVLPERAVNLAAGIAFVVFGVLSLRAEDDDAEEEEEAAAARASGRSAVLAVAGAFMVAELGDKTQLATLALAGRYPWYGVWPGAAAGMVAANVLALVVGVAAGKRLPAHALRIAAAALFFVFGALLLYEGLRG
ncbi:MAG TPA: TMEM165/GDT1 family protein [Acidimicrobiales bacterium]